MKPLIVIMCLLAAGCTSLRTAEAPQQKAELELLASIKVIQSAITAQPKGDSGYFFYLEAPLGKSTERSLLGYEYRDGLRSDVFGGGSDSVKIVQAIRDVGLEPFDFAAEVTATTARLKQEAESRGEKFQEWVVMDGAEYEITIHTATGVFMLKAWNPREIESLAPYSAKIAKLKAVLDILAWFYGRTKFGV